MSEAATMPTSFPPRHCILAIGFTDETGKNLAISQAKEYVRQKGYTSEDVKIVADANDTILVVTKREIKWKP